MTRWMQVVLVLVTLALAVPLLADHGDKIGCPRTPLREARLVLFDHVPQVESKPSLRAAGKSHRLWVKAHTEDEDLGVLLALAFKMPLQINCPCSHQ